MIDLFMPDQPTTEQPLLTCADLEHIGMWNTSQCCQECHALAARNITWILERILLDDDRIALVCCCCMPF